MIARKWGALLSTIFALCSCDTTTNVAGTNNETHTKGTFYQANGKPAVGAHVRVYAATQKENDSTSTLVTQDYVDQNGNVALKLKAGFYSLIAEDTLHHAVFLDSIFSDGNVVRLPTDTLRKTGTLVGRVHVQPWDSPTIAWVHLMRTNLFAKVDSSGTFRFSGVPAESFDLVAACRQSEYTPTHRLVQSLSDSIRDVGDIDLVYNGLPPVTGLQASYDSLSGVVTLRWHDTTYARKMGYLVYRQMGHSSTPTPAIQAYTTSANYHDTVFGGIGSKPNRFDSAEIDLTYWIGTKATDQRSSSPLWNNVRIHVKSPAQSRLWNVKLDSIPLGFSIGAGQIIDTTESGLLLLDGLRSDSSDAIKPTSTLLRENLQWDPTIQQDSSALWYRPVFWKGKLWQCAGFSTSRSLEYEVSYDQNLNPHYKLTPIFDSILIRSSSDGATWDSVRLAIRKDSVTNFVFRPHSERLEILLISNHGGILGTNSRFAIQGKLTTSDGKSWSSDPFNLGAPGEFLRVSSNQLHYSRSIGPKGEVWTEASYLWAQVNANSYLFYTGVNWPNGWLIPGEDTDTSHAILQTLGNLHCRSRGDLLVVGSLYIDPVDSRFQTTYSEISLVSPDTPLCRQRIEIPEPVWDFCFWHGKLVMLTLNRHIYIATITKTK